MRAAQPTAVLILAIAGLVIACGGRLETTPRPDAVGPPAPPEPGPLLPGPGFIPPYPPPPLPLGDAGPFPVGDGGAMSCGGGADACPKCGKDCSPDVAARFLEELAGKCASASGGGGSCSSITLDVGGDGCALGFAIPLGAWGSDARFVTCMQTALGSTSFACAASSVVKTGFSTGPCGGP